MIEDLRGHLTAIIGNVERAQQIGEPMWPLNEADTERIVVEPVLRALGYGDLDYRKRVQSAGANFPDYMMLPRSDQRWILEAKEWNARLDERCERQAVNYANNNGAQWAVLTNGRTWWIYNTRAPGDLSQQRAYELDDLRDVDRAVEVLSYLSRRSIQGGELDKAYRVKEITVAVLAQLRGRNKQVISTLRSVVARDLDRNVSEDDISEALAALIDARPTGPPSSAPASLDTGSMKSDEWLSLAELAAHAQLCTGETPAAVRMADLPVQPIETWRAAVVFLLENLASPEQVPVPLKTRRGHRFFLGPEPLHEDGVSMRVARQIKFGSRQVYVDVHRSARDLLKSASVVLTAAGVDPATVYLRLRRPE